MGFEFLINLIILISSLPVGWFLAWLCKDEIVFRRWFYILFYFFIVVTFLLIFLSRPIYEILVGVYITILVLVAIWKSRDKKFIKLKK